MVIYHYIFTIGTSTDPGLLPRTLDVIFNSVGQNQFEDFQIKPKFHSEAEYLKDIEQEREKEIKQDLLKQVHMSHNLREHFRYMRIDNTEAIDSSLLNSSPIKLISINITC